MLEAGATPEVDQAAPSGVAVGGAAECAGLRKRSCACVAQAAQARVFCRKAASTGGSVPHSGGLPAHMWLKGLRSQDTALLPWLLQLFVCWH